MRHLIGTGTLTSRMWVREMDDRIRFLRPLHNDDIQTSDRKFDLIRGEDDEKIELVSSELERLRYLATLSHPYVPPPDVVEADPLQDVRRRLQANKPHRKKFGL